MKVSFPAAIAEPKTRPFDYELVIEARELDVEATLSSFRFYSPTAMLAKGRDCGDVEFVLSLEELPKKAEFRFAVRALNSYGVKGAPVFSDWRRAGA